VVTQSEGASAAVLAALSIIVAQIEGLSSFTASIRRLGDLWDNLDEFDAEDAIEGGTGENRNRRTHPPPQAR
jgi:putative ATP-binding cassette transporter